MESKHIRGPWASQSQLSPGPWTYDGEDYIRDRNGVAIAHLSHSLQLSLSTAQANYKVFAAGQDLLEALVELKKWVGKLEDWRGEDPPTEIVDAAIKKATE